MDRLSHLGNFNAPRRLRGAQIGPDDFGQRVLVTCVDRLSFGHNAIGQVRNEFQKERSTHLNGPDARSCSDIQNLHGFFLLERSEV